MLQKIFNFSLRIRTKYKPGPIIIRPLCSPPPPSERVGTRPSTKLESSSVWPPSVRRAHTGPDTAHSWVHY